jgi:hypothetical protein
MKHGIVTEILPHIIFNTGILHHKAKKSAERDATLRECSQTVLPAVVHYSGNKKGVM